MTTPKTQDELLRGVVNDLLNCLKSLNEAITNLKAVKLVNEQWQHGELRCLDCYGTVFIGGPKGGAAQNVECANCHSRFNVSKMLNNNFFIERI